ncbi:MAG: shikimate dehydrogenase [Oscillospiraceae bacterium]|nr:shikimate dehydrogenase [Oscillospiraceae bacterium]
MHQLPPDSKFAVIGNPIAQSLSPAIHLPVLRHYAQNPSYERAFVSREDLPRWIERVRTEGYAGFNVTMPHKMDIGQHLDEVVMEADMLGSVNTVINRNGKLIGYSTDALGFFTALREAGIEYDDRRIVILGAGGAARVLAHRAILDRAARVDVFARRDKQAHEVVTSIRSHVRNAGLSWGKLDSLAMHRSLTRADILINATPLGMAGVEEQWEDLSFLAHLPNHAVVCDIIHTPRKTALLEKAEQLGHRTQNGVDMLIYQALVADTLFLGRNIDYPAMAKLVKRELYASGVLESTE